MLRTDCLKRPSVIFRIFALCTNASFFLLFIASSRANFAILSEAVRVMIFIATATPGVTSNSFPEYNPSVFSLTTIRSIPGFRAVTFGRVRAGRTLAYKLKRERIVTAALRGVPGSSGVVIGPFKHAEVRFIISTVFSGRFVPYFLMESNPASPLRYSKCTSPVFWTASKTMSVASTTSGPTPSPDRTAIEKGLEGVVIAKSSITFIDGQQGILRYRGIDINELAAKSSFEEVTYLLWNGSLPNKVQFSEFKKQLTTHRPLQAEVLKLLRATPKGAIPMEVARTAVSYMATFPRKKGETFDRFNRRESLQLTSTLPTIVASYERIRKGKTTLRPDPRSGHAANFLYGLWGKKPDEQSRAAFDTLSILYADHEMNASTFAAIVATSTLADLGEAVTSAIATLAGPLHGGSNQRVMEM